MAILILILLVIVYFAIGFCAARLVLLDRYGYDEIGIAWIVFFAGPVGWIIAILVHDNKKKLQAHFLDKFPPFIFLANAMKGDGRPMTNRIFRVKV